MHKQQKKEQKRAEESLIYPDRLFKDEIKKERN